MSPSNPPTHIAFFYGTLMAPAVLTRVCHGPSSSPSHPNPIAAASEPFRTRPALLPGFRRHRVRAADYPAIVRARSSEGGSGGGGAAVVRGTCVEGLTEADLWRLDIFEGDEYRREKVRVRVLANESGGEGEGGGHDEESGEEVEAETYVWIAGEARLESAEWDFAEFVREKMRFWVGREGAGEYAEVDDAVAAQQSLADGTGGRGFNGHIAQALEQEQQKDRLLQNAV